MTDLRTAAQQALEALTNCTSEYGHRCNRCDSEVDEGGKVVEALRAALVEPVQEPVAYIHRQGRHWEVSERHLDDGEKARGWTEEPLYTDPPQRKPLSEQDIWDAVQHGVVGGIGLPSKAVAVARAIERAHGIGGSDE